MFRILIQCLRFFNWQGMYRSKIFNTFLLKLVSRTLCNVNFFAITNIQPSIFHPKISSEPKQAKIFSIKKEKKQKYGCKNASETFLPVEKWLFALTFSPYVVIHMQIVPITMTGINLKAKTRMSIHCTITAKCCT